MKKMIKTTGLIFAFALLAIINSYAQAPAAIGTNIPDVQNSFNQYHANALTEKLYVHTDKNAYTTGELLWFKIYNVDGANHQPLDLSKVVYVEVLDNNQNPVLQAKIAMKNGTGSGSLYLPVTLTNGNYLLRAYTSWMKNFSPEFYFHKQLTIINPLKSPEVEAKVITPDYDIQFFPEGGNLVNGITSTVGFKATDEWGKGVSFKGAVLDKNNDTVARFQPFKFGIGSFSFKPGDNGPYRAVIKIAGKPIQKDLPAINQSGYVMHMADNGMGGLTVSVITNMPASTFYLFAHTRGVIKAVEMAATDNGAASFTIDKNKLGDGISHLTVFNADRQPICERLFFKQPAKQLVLAAATDQPEYNTRKKVDIAINAADQDNRPVVADLSLSVYRLDSLQHISLENIQNYLWLSSDLKGIIESPEYYFKGDDTEAAKAADNLMLTQGWSRFDWNEVLKNKKPAFTFLPEYNGPIINGKLIIQATNQPARGIVTYLAIPGKSVQMSTSVSDSLGRLTFLMKGFYGPAEIVAQTNTAIDTGYRIDISNPFSEQYAKIQLPHLTIAPDLKNALENESLAMQVQNIYNSAKMRQFYDPNVDSSAFYGTPEKTYLLDNYTRFTTMEEVMREYVLEGIVSHAKDQYHIKVFSPDGFLREGDPLLMIDGVPFFDLNKLFALDPLKMRKLEVMPYIYYWGPSTEDGIFSFTSYKGDLAGTEIDPHAVVLDYEGMQLQRQFYSPEYDKGDAYASRLPDFRNVLYWAPYIATNPQGKNTLSIYTSDQTGKYIGVLQGLTANGNAGCGYFMFDVKK